MRKFKILCLCIKYKKKKLLEAGTSKSRWRRVRDSNPRVLAGYLISSTLEHWNLNFQSDTRKEPIGREKPHEIRLFRR